MTADVGRSTAGRCELCHKRVLLRYALWNEQMVGPCCLREAIKQAEADTLDEVIDEARRQAIADEERDHQRAKAIHSVWHAAGAMQAPDCPFCNYGSPIA